MVVVAMDARWTREPVGYGLPGVPSGYWKRLSFRKFSKRPWSYSSTAYKGCTDLSLLCISSRDRKLHPDDDVLVVVVVGVEQKVTMERDGPILK